MTIALSQLEQETSYKHTLLKTIYKLVILSIQLVCFQHKMCRVPFAGG